jgi:hypothetical protein
VLAVLFVVTLVFSAALLALVRDATQLRRTLSLLERRIVTLELDSAATVVIEPSPEAEALPRPRNALVN